jgi:hypothetical protein
MNDDSARVAQPRPRPFDIALVIVGPTVLVGLGMPADLVALWGFGGVSGRFRRD